MMSICPDKDLYSVYVDGELPSPWKEKLEAHLNDCAECRAVVNSYRNLSLKLATAGAPELDIESSFLRLCEKRQVALNKAKITEKKENWFYKSVKIPIPALAAAALFLFVFTPMLIMNTNKDVQYETATVSNFKPIVPAANITAETPKKFNFTDFHTLGIKNSNFTVSTQKRVINFDNFTNLYLPVDMGYGGNIMNIKMPGFGSAPVKDTEQFDITFVKNE
ncbi:anti-sigma factor family protein [Treponema pedis]|uniref:anti-sigma factor family protein n=2 Tax=Treponema pedis TaxID=409322 RepID=UPI0009B77E40|nr:zf-HC2 domain-containing protein [Treponema pedis]